MNRLPRGGERLIRGLDGKRFAVAHVTTVEGGELHFALRADDGERASACLDDFFPPAALPPYRFE